MLKSIMSSHEFIDFINLNPYFVFKQTIVEMSQSQRHGNCIKKQRRAALAMCVADHITQTTLVNASPFAEDFPLVDCPCAHPDYLVNVLTGKLYRSISQQGLCTTSVVTARFLNVDVGCRCINITRWTGIRANKRCVVRGPVHSPCGPETSLLVTRPVPATASVIH